MRKFIDVERLRHSNGSYLVGPDATKVLSGIEGVSAIRLERQYIDRALLSYECSYQGANPARMDQLLASKGLRMVQTNETVVRISAASASTNVKPVGRAIERRPPGREDQRLRAQ